MNVLFVFGNSGNAGANQSLISMIYHLKKNHNIEPIIVLPEEGPIKKKIEDTKIKYYILNFYGWTKSPDQIQLEVSLKWGAKSFFNYLATKKIRNIIQREKIDIVHINALTFSVGAAAAITEKIPLVWHIREFLEEDLELEFVDKQSAIQLINKATKLIAVSDVVKDKFSKLLDPNKIIRIYNGIDDKQYNDKINNLFSNNQTTFTIAGRIVPSKGQEYAIRAIAILVKKGYNVLLQIVGGSGKGEYEKNLINLVKRLELQDYVTFVGYTNDVSKIWLDSDVSLICSQAEAFGRVTIEGMMAGTVVIGADTEGTAELIDNGKFGYLYEEGNYENLAEVIEYVLNNKKEAKNKANKAKQYALENFTSEINAKNVYKVYRDIIL